MERGFTKLPAVGGVKNESISLNETSFLGMKVDHHVSFVSDHRFVQTSEFARTSEFEEAVLDEKALHEKRLENVG